MTLALANLILSKPFGFVTDADLPQIIALDRLVWLLVRCGAQHGRFAAPAQDIPQLIATIEATGDWVRDVSFPSCLIDEARAFQAANPPPLPEHARARLHAHVAKVLRNPKHSLDDFNEADCGGAFDGFTVSSDADSGL